MATSWTKINKAASTSWTKITKAVINNGMASGTPIGLLLALTYASGIGATGTWTKINKAASTSWTKITKAT